MLKWRISKYVLNVFTSNVLWRLDDLPHLCELCFADPRVFLGNRCWELIMMRTCRGGECWWLRSTRRCKAHQRPWKAPVHTLALALALAQPLSSGETKQKAFAMPGPRTDQGRGQVARPRLSDAVRCCQWISRFRGWTLSSCLAWSCPGQLPRNFMPEHEENGVNGTRCIAWKMAQ